MADQGRWFKLWVTSDDDPDLTNLSLEDFARWCLFGVFLKKHGTDGTVSLIPPCTALMQKFRVQSFSDCMQVIAKFPNCSVSLETNPTVTWHNWGKYQGDFSSDRVRKFRNMKRSKKRGEEKRGEEKRKIPPSDIPPHVPEPWPPDWKPISDRITTLPFLAKHKAWLEDLDWWKTLDELFTSCPVSLDILLTQAVAYCQSEGYVPRTKAAIRKKLKNCMEFSARRAEREAQERRRSPISGR